MQTGRRGHPSIRRALSVRGAAMTHPDLSRREFLRAMSAAGLATVAGGAPRLLADEPVEHPKPTADTCILLWMAGGMAAPETFDPKRYTPFEVGTAVEK